MITGIALAAALSLGAPTLDRSAYIMSVAGDRMVHQEDIWFQDGEFPTDIQVLRVEAEMYPADYDIWTNLGWMQENVHDWDGALSTYVRYRRSNPNEPDAALPEAFYYQSKKLYAKIPALLEPEIKHACHPNNFRILASAYEKQGMLADSERVWKIYLQRDPTDGAAKHNLDRVEKKLAAKA